MQYKPLDLTQQLIRLNTINPPGKERECARFLGELLGKNGFRVRYYEYEDSRTSLVASLDGEDETPPICFTGHLDTVPLGEKIWQKHALSAETDGDRVFGRGTTDMKGGIAAMTLAALRLARNRQLRSGVMLVFTASEETGCEGADYLANKLRVLEEPGAIVVGEPTGNLPLIGHKGGLWIEVCATGVTAHASIPHHGVNAIYKAAEVIRHLQHFDFDVPTHPVLGAPTLNVGTISGGLNMNSVPDRATLGIDIRTIPGQTPESILEKLRATLGPDIMIRKLHHADSIYTEPQQEWMQSVFSIMKNYLPAIDETKAAPYVTDASIFKPALAHPPTVILGPGEIEMAHKTDEYCHISKIEMAVDAYFDILRDWCL
ncbi:MAG: M20 family metallopeptidase [SAR324 cluster bacterium]|nr:M20 family metallopeptidase [SAR324 cluster bacterium]